MYKDFKSYIQANYGDLLRENIQKFVEKHHDGQESCEFNKVSLLNHKVGDIQVISLSCPLTPGVNVKINTHVKAEIILQNLATPKTEVARKSRWFTVYLAAYLEYGLHDVEVVNVDEYFNGEYDNENVLDAYMVPDIGLDHLEECADLITSFFCNKNLYNGEIHTLKRFFARTGLRWFEAELPRGEMGRIYFRGQVVKVDEYFLKPEEKSFKRQPVNIMAEPGTMLINRDCYFLYDYGGWADTLAHEIVHWCMHAKFFEIMALLNENENSLHCEIMPVVSNENLEGLEKARWFVEWQANVLAPRILMPRWIFNDYFSKKLQAARNNLQVLGLLSEGAVMEEALAETAEIFHVSKEEVKVRAIQLGYKQADGTFIHIDGDHQRRPFSFNPDAIGAYQTFILDNRNFHRLYDSDKKFHKWIDDGQFIYTGCLVCIKDPLYVQQTEDPTCPQGYDLTRYALDHVDECCLKFTRRYTQENKYTEYYNTCYLSRNINSADFSETRDIEYECNQSVEDQEKNLRELDVSYDTVLNLLDTLPGSFYGTFDAHMKRSKKENGRKMTNEELSYRTGISKDYIGTLRNETTNIKFETVCALCQGLHLHPVLSDDMIAKAVGKYPQTKEGLNAQDILHNHFHESLKVVNARLRKQGYPLWGCDEKIIV